MANHKKTKRPRKPQHHLPKVGTPADDAHRLEQSRKDLLDFGLAKPKHGVTNWVIAIVAVVVLVLGTIALIALT